MEHPIFNILQDRNNQIEKEALFAADSLGKENNLDSVCELMK